MDNINPKAIYSFIYFVFDFSCDEKHLKMEEKMSSKKNKTSRENKTFIHQHIIYNLTE